MDADEYEYAVRRVGIRLPTLTYIIGDFWADREDRQAFIDELMRVPPEYHTYKLVRRRKAGPEEEVKVE